MTQSKVRGNRFNFADQGVFYSYLDMYPTGVSLTGAQNRTNIIAALTTIAAAGGGVLLVPHGVTHTFDPTVDFPVSANALCVWEFKGNSFKLMGNLAITSSLGNVIETSLYEETRTVSHQVIDAIDPVTYTFEMRVDDAGISGSSNDLCQYIPGGTLVEAIARAGANLGKHFFLKGINVVGGITTDTLTASGALSALTLAGVKKYNKEIFTPATGAPSIDLADTTEHVILDHSATIAAKTITLPAAPVDGQSVMIYSRSVITALTVAAGAGESIAGGPAVTTIAAAGRIGYMYNHSNTSWYRIA